MLRLRFPAFQRRLGLDGQRSRPGEHRRTLAAEDERDANASSKSFDLVLHTAHSPVARTLIARVRRRHRRGIVQQNHEVFVHARRPEARACENKRQCQRGEAFENQTCGDRKLTDSSPAFRRLTKGLPEEQSGNRPWWKLSPEHMNRDDRGNAQQRKKSPWCREDHDLDRCALSGLHSQPLMWIPGRRRRPAPARHRAAAFRQQHARIRLLHGVPRAPALAAGG